MATGQNDKDKDQKDQGQGQSQAGQGQGGINITKQDLSDILQVAIKAAQAPSAAELAEQEAEKKRMEMRRRVMHKLVQTAEAAKKKRVQMCRHRKPDGEECVGGQSYSDGMVRQICLRCQTIMYEEPTPELQVAKAEIQRLIDAGKIKVRRDGTVEMYENRLSPSQPQVPGRMTRETREEAGIEI